MEPGVVATPIFGKSETARDELDPYPHARRLQAIFDASLERPVPPSLVADAIRDIVASDSPQLRHPVGPDALPYLQWRASLSDEQVIEYWGLDDEQWVPLVERDFGLSVGRHFRK